MRVFAVIILAVLAVIGALTLGGAVVAWNALSGLRHAEAERPEQSLLVIDLDQPFRDGGVGQAADGLFAATPSLHGVIAVLDAAATDEEVKGLIARFGPSGRGMAQAQELREAVLRFKASGKPTFAFADSLGDFGGTPADYYLASAFGRVWLQPSGMLGLNGFQMEVPFVRQALTDLGISTEFGQRWEYKNAADTVVRNDMSAPQRASIDRMFQSWQAQVIEGIAASRSIDPAKLAALIQQPPQFAADAKAAGLVDAVGYWDEMLAAAQDATGTRDTFAFNDYLGLVAATPQDGSRIAVIEARGTVHRGESEIDGSGGYSSIGSDTVAQAVRDAIDDPDVKAIILRIDSPGGDYIAADSIWRELMRARDKRLPVIATLGDVAASGGYFIAMPARKIIAQPGTITGSIGVFAGKVVLTELWNKLGIRWESVQTSPTATLWSPNRTFTPAERAWFDRMLDTIYADFTAKVGATRNLTPAQLDQVARGRVWTGTDAKAVGLVDDLGGFDTALRLARQEAGIAPDAKVTLKPFPAPPEGLEALFQLLHGTPFLSLIGTATQAGEVMAPLAPLWRQLRTGAAMQGPSLMGWPPVQ